MKFVFLLATAAMVSAVPLSLRVSATSAPTAAGTAAPTAEAPTPPNKMPKVTTCGDQGGCTECVGVYGCVWQSKACVGFFDSKDTIARASEPSQCDEIIDDATESKTPASFIRPTYPGGCPCAPAGPTVAYATDTTPSCACANSFLQAGSTIKARREGDVLGILASLGDKEGMAEEARMEAVRKATMGILGETSDRLEGIEALSGLNEMRAHESVEADVPAIDFSNFDTSTLKSLDKW